MKLIKRLKSLFSKPPEPEPAVHLKTFVSNHCMNKSSMIFPISEVTASKKPFGILFRHNISGDLLEINRESVSRFIMAVAESYVCFDNKFAGKEWEIELTIKENRPHEIHF